MKISSVDCVLISAPYAGPGDDECRYHLQQLVRPATFLRVNSDEGIHGLGETYSGVYAPDVVAALVRQFEPELVGLDAQNPTAAWERIHLASRYWGRTGITQSVIGGIEMALWDLLGKALDQPVHSLLGGAVHQSIPVYASGGNNKPIDELRTEMHTYVDAGFHAIKVRINNLPDVDAIVKKIAVCSEAVGGRARLAADAAQGLARQPWTAKQALAVARELEPFNLLWLEEPVGVTDYQGFARVRSASPIPIAGGETVTSLVEAEAYLEAAALDLFQPDASLIGGIGVLRTVADLCDHRGVPIAIHTWSAGVGMMGNYHAAFACRNCQFLEMPCVANPLREEVLVDPLHIDNGRLHLPRSPGLGVELPAGIENQYPYQPGSLYRVLGYEDRSHPACAAY